MGMTNADDKANKLVVEKRLANLCIKQTALDKLNSLLYAYILAASDKALAETADELKIQNLRNSGYCLQWSATFDGKIVVDQPTGKQVTKISAGILLLIGLHLTESGTFPLMVQADKSQSDNRNT